jgi:hypothetical protein
MTTLSISLLQSPEHLRHIAVELKNRIVVEIFHLGAEKGCRISFVAIGRDIARVHTIGGNQEDIGKPIEVAASGGHQAG